ncbi:SDR family oxidoreductase [Pseudomonas sp. RIT-PI-S]|uniref:SDR family oxidoreductase n=1 Tax=Pseudomonas sp. RIT-PI-S TaxID=3035295 RepID=UPI0021D7EE3B|nr:SDR family oxidoreductase [Pseudomonas sp. RIT-PI-S]
MSITLITGCSSGIGLALAHSLRAAGHEVWATARQERDLAALAAAGFTAHRLDVTDPGQCQALAALLQAHGKGLGVLVNNAGYGGMGPLLDQSDELLRRQFDTNVISLVTLTRALFPLLKQSGGRVVNIGSVSGVLVTPFAGAYCASKAAVHALSDALRMELAPFGIQVMEVQPGAIATRFADNASAEAEQVIAEGSAWWPMRDGIRARARASQNHPTPATEVAARITQALARPTSPRLLRVGRGCWALPLLAALAPKGLLERMLRRSFGL